MTRGRALILLVLATACWGAAAAMSERAVQDISAFDLLTLELGTATLILWAAQSRRPWVTPTLGFAALGLLEPALTFIGINLGLERTSASTGSLLLTLESVFGVLLALVFLRERVERGTVIALALGVAGAMGSAGAFLLYTVAIPHITASVGATVLNLVPVFGLLTTVLALGERPSVVQLAGGALVMAGPTALRRPGRAAYSVL